MKKKIIEWWNYRDSCGFPNRENVFVSVLLVLLVAFCFIMIKIAGGV